MRWPLLAVAIWSATLHLLVTGAVAHDETLKGVEAQTESPQYVANSFIVEFNPDHVAMHAWEVRMRGHYSRVRRR